MLERMSKAILVMDMPENCKKCKFNLNYPNAERYCYIKQIAHNEEKPDWCPLKEIPEKIKSNELIKEAEKDDCFDGCDDEITYFEGKEAGWNACIDEIMKGIETDE